MQEEFASRVSKKVSDDDFKLIDFVYMWHPLISEVEGKDQVAYLFNQFGIGIFREMEPKANEAMRIEVEISKLKKEIEKLTQELADLKK